jgi:Gamma-glutamyl cyclotransferase, AIG2-like
LMVAGLPNKVPKGSLEPSRKKRGWLDSNVRPSIEVIAMTEEKGRRIDVFFYGLFMDDALLREKGINPVYRRMAFVENFSLVIGERATLVPCANAIVHGVLFSLTHGEMDALYSESSVNAYRPEAVFAQLEDGSVTPALCFNLPVPPSTDERNPQYVSKLRELADRIGLPSAYVSSIQ